MNLFPGALFRGIAMAAFMVLAQVQIQARTIHTDLLIIGGGASGTTAGIQAARMGVQTLIIEETRWLGGMLTSAGVSAIDGNHNMPSGLWGEFRQKLYDHYGGPEEVETGWVSNTLFEPSVGNQVLKELAGHKNLDIWYETTWQRVEQVEDGWRVTVRKGRKKKVIAARVLIDATELGDVMAAAGVPYDIGMDSRYDTGEQFAPARDNDIIQDMTYVVILKDYGKGTDRTIPEPAGYDPAEFACACDVSDPAGDGTADTDCEQMIRYGRLPNNKYMINWPKCGNDIYLNIIEQSRSQREEALREAKLHTLRFVYYLQTELGFKHLGIARDEFPTDDGFPMIPYHRESRRMEGLATLTVDHMAEPYGQDKPYYRTGIAVGDYPIDHHHAKNADAPEIDFVKIKVPAYNVPLGSLVPVNVDGLIVAEKSISVSNIANGATRLQPVVLGIGQAAGALAAVCIRNGVQPGEADIRKVQQELLDADAYLMPFIDVKPEDRHFEAIQRIGATGILEGAGVPYKWANQTWFYPGRSISEYELVSGLQTYYPEIAGFPATGSPLTLGFMAKTLHVIDTEISYEKITAGWSRLFPDAGEAAPDVELNRGQAAVFLDRYLDPFAIPVDFDGKPQFETVATKK